jgi:hypothetical protein
MCSKRQASINVSVEFDLATEHWKDGLNLKSFSSLKIEPNHLRFTLDRRQRWGQPIRCEYEDGVL